VKNNIIKLLCDIDLLIQGLLDEKHKSGLFYMQLEICKNLLKIDNIKLTFISNHYLPENFKKITQILNIKPQNILNNLSIKEKKLIQINHKKIELLKNNPAKTLKVKIKRLFISIHRKIIKIFIPNTTLNKNNLEKFDIYQSFYYPIPKKIIKSNINTSIFIHDLIPIVYKKHVLDKKANKVEQNFKKIFNSIQTNTLIFTNSEYTKNDLFKIYPKFKKNKIIVSYLGINKNKFFHKKNRNNKNNKDRLEIQNSLKKYNIPTDKPYFLSLCSLNPRKNLEFTTNCFIKFLKQNPKADVNFVIAGAKGWQTDKLFNIIKEHSKNIIQTNFIKDKDINNIYNGALAFIYPSLYEGFGMPIVEAMQCGIPVISSNASCLPEVARDAGILIDPKKEKDFINAFKKLYTNKKLREELKQKSIKRAKDFNWNKTINNLIQEYKILKK